MRKALLVVAAAAWLGCGSLSSYDGFRLPSEVRGSQKTFAVLHQEKDKRNLDRLIERRLRHSGLAIAASPVEADYVVRYVDRWYWDMRIYLIDFRLDVRDARTNVLVATGRAFQTSLAALGETPESIIDRSVRIVLDGPETDARRSAAAP